MRGLYSIREIAGSSYYRSRPIASLQFLYSKWKFSRKRVDDPLAMLKAAGVEPIACMNGFDNWEHKLQRVISDVARYRGQGGINMPEGKFLYGITRALRPEFVIETGVAAGISSCFLIAALIENGSGRLYSIDLPADGESRLRCPDAANYDWPQKGVAWGIPTEMRARIGERHILILDDVRRVLPKLLSNLPHVDVFFHDDLHLPDHMFWEYESVWPRLREGGVLASHDVNMGWIRFCREYNLPGEKLVNLNRLCAVQKLSEVLQG